MDEQSSNEFSVDAARPEESRRELERTRSQIEAWLRDKLGASGAPEVTSVTIPEGNGMSSETVLVDASWIDDGERGDHALVFRIAPDTDAVPVFESYDFEMQFRVMRTVGELCDVPVPEVYWLETDPAALGAPFFVMARAEGDVPPDVMPYNFGDTWLYDASREDQQRLVDSTLSALVQLHAIDDPESHFAFLSDDSGDSTDPGDSTGGAAVSALRRHVDAQRRYYEWVSRDGDRSPLIERTFDWLDAHWPADEGPTVLSWGDARIGNVMYRDFEPSAVLDWEMASLAPREVDLAWMIFLHRFFEDIAATLGVDGMPWFLRRDDVERRYAELSGVEPKNMDFYAMYAALRHAVVMSQVQRRAIAFGQMEMPDDVDDLIMHRAVMEEMLEGTYWPRVLG